MTILNIAVFRATWHQSGRSVGIADGLTFETTVVMVTRQSSHYMCWSRSGHMHLDTLAFTFRSCSVSAWQLIQRRNPWLTFCACENIAILRVLLLSQEDRQAWLGGTACDLDKEQRRVINQCVNYNQSTVQRSKQCSNSPAASYILNCWTSSTTPTIITWTIVTRTIAQKIHRC